MIRKYNCIPGRRRGVTKQNKTGNEELQSQLTDRSSFSVPSVNSTYRGHERSPYETQLRHRNCETSSKNNGRARDRHYENTTLLYTQHEPVLIGIVVDILHNV